MNIIITTSTKTMKRELHQTGIYFWAKYFVSPSPGRNIEHNRNIYFPSSGAHRLLNISSDPLSAKAIIWGLWAASGSRTENILHGRIVHRAYENKSSVLWINVRAQCQTEAPVCTKKIYEKNKSCKWLKNIIKIPEIITHENEGLDIG